MPRNSGIKEYWNVRARNYDEFYSLIRARQQLVSNSQYLLNGLHRHYHVCAELGCGTGRLTEVLAQVATKVVAVDIADEMIKVARQRLAGSDLEDNIEWVVDEAVHYLKSQDADSFDLCAAGLLTHQMDPATKTEFIKECFRVLRNSGDLFITEQVVCDQRIQVPSDAAARRKILYNYIIKGFYEETGPPSTFRDEFEYTNTDMELLEQLKHAGFSDRAIYSHNEIVGLFFAKKRPPGYLPPAFPQLKTVASNPPALSLPDFLSGRFEIVSEEPAPAGRRFQAREKASGLRVIIDLLPAGPGSASAQEQMAELLQAHKIACCELLEGVVDGSDRAVVWKQPDGYPCTADFIGRLSLYEILKLLHYLLKMHHKLDELGVEHTLIPAGLVLNESACVIIGDLRLLKGPSGGRVRSEEDSAALRRIGQLMADSLRRHGKGFSGLELTDQARDSSEYPPSLPLRVEDLVNNLTSGRLTCTNALKIVDKYFGFTPTLVKDPLAVNKEFISLLEFETLSPKSWAKIWERCSRDARHRDLLYEVFRKYRSVHSKSNLLGILATHDYEKFKLRCSKRLSQVGLRYVLLKEVSFAGWDLADCEIKDCRFQNCDFSNATLNDVRFVNCEFKECSFGHVAALSSSILASQFNNCLMMHANLAHMNFERSKLIECDVDRASLEGANLHSASLKGGTGIENCNLRNVNAFNVEDDEPWRKAISKADPQKIRTYEEFKDAYSELYPDQFESAYAWLSRVAR